MKTEDFCRECKHFKSEEKVLEEMRKMLQGNLNIVKVHSRCGAMLPLWAEDMLSDIQFEAKEVDGDKCANGCLLFEEKS